ncbi:MAG: hypothetical protein JO227_19725 [Acetobacteraceae bacterium]|nr:hypothetical protein [Acetobacteraceae bacterium]
MTTNELLLAKAFRDAGIPQDKAESLAETIFDAIRDSVATKTDVETTKADLRTAMQVISADLIRLEHRLTLRGLGALVTGLGILFGALHYWPPHL